MKLNLICLSVLLLMIGLTQVGMAEIVLSDPYPTNGTPTTITITNENHAPVGNIAISVIYRPNSKVKKVTENIGRTDRSGRFEWTPEEAGICTIKAQNEAQGINLSKNIAVKFSGFPIGGLIIFLFAGVLLYGGIAFSYVKLVKD